MKKFFLAYLILILYILIINNANLFLITLNNSDLGNTSNNKINRNKEVDIQIDTKLMQSSQVPFNYSLYQLFPNFVTWHQAQSICEEIGMHLVAISSAEENTFINNLVDGMGTWIGMSDEENEGDWVWITGEPVIYTNWNEGQPDNWGEGEDFASLEGEELWNDVGTQQGSVPSNRFVCESQQNLNSIQLSTGSFNYSIYQVFYTPMTWEQAKVSCQDLSMYLVTISSGKENAFVNELTPYINIWIGFTDENNEGNWEWITGETVIYTNWQSSEPNDSQTGEDYALFGVDGSWIDYGGSSDYSVENMYVCESNDSDQDEISDHFEILIGLNPYKNDAFEDLDGDSLPNLWEYEMGLNLTIDDAYDDLDQDGLSNLEEFQIGTSAKLNDSDQDGMDDYWEVTMKLNPLKNDTLDDKDGDWIPNIVEYIEKNNANDFLNFPILKSEFPFIYISLPILLLPIILMTFFVSGVGIAFVLQNSKRKKLIKETNAFDFETAKLVKKGKFVDYEEYKLALELNVTTAKDYRCSRIKRGKLR